MICFGLGIGRSFKQRETTLKRTRKTSSNCLRDSLDECFRIFCLHKCRCHSQIKQTKENDQISNLISTVYKTKDLLFSSWIICLLHQCFEFCSEFLQHVLEIALRLGIAWIRDKIVINNICRWQISMHLPWMERPTLVESFRMVIIANSQS